MSPIRLLRTLFSCERDQSLHSVHLTDLDSKSYAHILSVVLSEMGKLDLLVQGVPKSCSFWGGGT